VAEQQQYTDDEPLAKGLADHVGQGNSGNPYAGSIVPPVGAGTRTESTARRKSEHEYGGMLAGGTVLIHLRSERGRTVHRCRVLEFVSVPAPHLVVELETTTSQRAHRRIFFCSAIDWIDPADEA
jgi:hypothetical protein